MRDFLTDPEYASAREALSVTGLPTLSVNVADRPVDPEAYSNPKTSGEYDPKTNTMWTRSTPNAFRPNAHISAVHEYGHAIWFKAFENSLLQRKINAVQSVVADTYQIRRLVGESELALDYMEQHNIKVYSYLLTPTEVFARAVAQYVFTKPEQSVSNRADWLDYAGGDYESYTRSQWTPDDFEPVLEAFDKTFY